MGNFGKLYKEHKLDSEKLLAGSKYKSIQFWTFEESSQLYRFYGAPFGKQTKIPEALDIQQWANAITRVFPAKPSSKNPVYFRIYIPSVMKLSLGLLPFKFETNPFDLDCADFGLQTIYDTELMPKSLADYAIFSTTIYPQLRFKDEIKVISLRRNEGSPKFQKQFIKGVSLKDERLSIDIRFGDDPANWILELIGDQAWLLEGSTIPLMADPFIALGYSPPAYYPKIISDPSNQIVHELYKIVLLLDTTDKMNDPQVSGNLVILLESFVDRANQNDVMLFPHLARNPELKIMAISKTVKEFKKMEIRNANLRNIVDNAMKKFNGSLPISGKKAKTDDVKDKMVSYEFKLLRPYLDLSYPPQKDTHMTAPKNSLLFVYWSIISSHLNPDRMEGKKFWE